jgi:cytochrome c5
VDQQDRSFMTVFGAILGLLVLITIAIVFLARSIVDTDSAGQDTFRVEQMTEQLVKPGRVVVAGTPDAEKEQAGGGAAAGGGDQAELSGEQLYTQVCASCHAQGLLNAPKLGSADVWQARYDQGLDTLVQHVVKGFNQMPAQGQAPGATEANIKEAIIYMLAQSNITLAAADQPAVAEGQAATEQPAVAEEQAATEQPAVAEEQAATEQPAVAEEQAATEQPAVAEEQAATEQPAVAEEQAATEQPAAEATAGLVIPADTDLAQGQQVYENVCRFCHLGNIPSAPKLGDKEAWAPRMAQGWDTLADHVLNGFKGMPAKGGRTDLADDQIVNALGYMLNESQ